MDRESTGQPLVLVTGGAGFIGAHCVQHLLAAGRRVRVLDHAIEGSPLSCLLARGDIAVAALQIQQGDIRDRGAVSAAMDGVTQVLHLAAQVSVASSVAVPLDSASTNITGFLHVLEASRQAGAQRFVYASSAAVYGNAPAPQHEERLPQPCSPYALEKQVNEQYAALYLELHGLPTLGLRYFNVYGPGQRDDSEYAGVIARFARCIRAGQPVSLHGDGAQTRDFVHVHDVARLSCAALEIAATGVVNIGTGMGSRIVDLLHMQMEAGTRVPVLKTARQPGDLDHSCATVGRMHALFGPTPLRSLQDGLRTAAHAAMRTRLQPASLHPVHQALDQG